MVPRLCGVFLCVGGVGGNVGSVCGQVCVCVCCFYCVCVILCDESGEVPRPSLCSTYFMTSHPVVNTLKVKDVDFLRPYTVRYTREKFDVANFVFDLDADLSSVFNWNVKQLFVYITAEYATADNVRRCCGCVVVWLCMAVCGCVAVCVCCPSVLSSLRVPVPQFFLMSALTNSFGCVFVFVFACVCARLCVCVSFRARACFVCVFCVRVLCACGLW